MSKTKTVFFCKECGNESPKWIGHCPACGAWNSYVEESVVTGKKKYDKTESFIVTESVPVPISEIKCEDEERLDLYCQELNRVLGGGLVQGSLVLLGGEPGIGKSTLLLQTALYLKKRCCMFREKRVVAKSRCELTAWVLIIKIVLFLLKLILWR